MRHFLASAVVCAAACLLAAPQTASAAMIDFNLNNGTITPGDFYDSGAIPFGPRPLNPGESYQVWINFRDGGTKQHLEIMDTTPVSVPDESVFGNLGGSGVADLNLRIILTGVTGELDFPPSNPVMEDVVIFDGLAVFNNGTSLDNSDVFGDFTDASFFFHDIHFEFTNLSTQPIVLNSVNFNAEGNFITIGEWPQVPEPSTLVLWSLGAVALVGLGRRRRKHAA